MKNEKSNNKVIYHTLATFVLLYYSFENLIIYHFLNQAIEYPLLNAFIYLIIVFWLIMEGYKEDETKN